MLGHQAGRLEDGSQGRSGEPRQGWCHREPAGSSPRLAVPQPCPIEREPRGTPGSRGTRTQVRPPTENPGQGPFSLLSKRRWWHLNPR